MCRGCGQWPIKMPNHGLTPVIELSGYELVNLWEGNGVGGAVGGAVGVVVGGAVGGQGE